MQNKTRRTYFSQLDDRVDRVGKKFWKTIKPLLLEKSYHKESFSLFTKNNIITKFEDLAKNHQWTK